MLLLSHARVPAPTYTLSLHDALPISPGTGDRVHRHRLLHHPGSLPDRQPVGLAGGGVRIDRKSTRLNSSHVAISYAVFCSTKQTTGPTPVRKDTPRRADPAHGVDGLT